MYNRTIIVGRLTADPELKQTPNGVSVCSFSVAVSRAYAPKGGERQTDFFNVVAWRSTAEFICRYFIKGNALLIEGSMESREYTDKNNQNRRVWELIANNVSFVESKKDSQGGGHNAGYGEPPPERGQQSGSSAAAPAAYSNTSEDFADIDDDGDLPF
jgi:single-strand DNA-binding protein